MSLARQTKLEEGGRRGGGGSITSLGRRPSTRKPVRGFTYSIAGFFPLSFYYLRAAVVEAATARVFVGLPFLLLSELSEF